MMEVIYKKGKYIVLRDGTPYLKFDTEEEANVYIAPPVVVDVEPAFNPSIFESSDWGLDDD